MSTAPVVAPKRKGPPKGGQRIGGRGKGTPNKVTTDARAAIAQFVDGNAHRMAGWLDDIAHGVPNKRKPGEYLVPPNPSRAFDMMQSVIEYHVPKLARTELTGDGGGPITVTIQKVA
jgi:hypothetical protein